MSVASKVWMVVGAGLLACVVALPFTACGDDGATPDSSGVDPAAVLNALAEADKRDFCEWATQVLGGTKEHDCGGGDFVVVPSVNDCVAQFASYENCSATVGDMEGCYNVIGDEPCKLDAAPECEPLRQCE